MRAVKAVPKPGVADAIAKGTCPVCNAIKEFQSAMLGTAKDEGAAHLCNYHAWALAKSSPADIAGEIFLKLIQLWRRNTGVAASGCDSCQSIRNEEQASFLRQCSQCLPAYFPELPGIWTKICAHSLRMRMKASTLAVEFWVAQQDSWLHNAGLLTRRPHAQIGTS